MRRTTWTAVVLALGCLAGGAADANAAWNNVFQTTACCGESTRSYYFAPAPTPCCPTTSYVQRCYYQPVTTYKTESYYEPITTYRTSNYWEPVTSYRYTSYYDPCSGCSQTVATPCTSYYLRQRCNAVQSYVQRCRMVPVTEMRKSFYLEPVVTYTDPCGNPCPSCGGGAATGAIAPAAGIAEPSRGQVPTIGESGEPPRIKPPAIQESGSKKVTPVPTVPMRADRTASRTLEGGRLAGQVVRDDRITPRANATLKFVGDQDQQVTAKADAAGRFAVEVPAGEWTLYLVGADGKESYHSTLLVRREDDRRVTVVSR
ncbi:MAG TPA: hypothetical protein VHR66_21035 [Gemmataceae bacterium]|jgi:hypothetical protein|nr:hypothetical protein [Gemmataceae bacterium]